jgi:hypothetical protein
MKPNILTLAHRRVRSRPTAAKSAAPAPFHAFIAYADLPAARRAMSTISDVLRATQGKFAFKPMLWRFDQLAHAKWCDYAISDAAEAAVVVLASSAPGPAPAAIEQWVSSLLQRKRGQRTTVVSLQGEDEAWTISIEAPAKPAEVRSLPMPMAQRAA